MENLVKLRAAMAEQDLDAIIVTSELNQRYLCGYGFTDGLIVITKTDAYMVTDFRYYEEAGRAVYPEFKVEMPTDRRGYVTEILSGCKRVGYEDVTLSCAAYERMKATYTDITLCPIGGMIEKIREVKSADELRKMEEAQKITDAAFAHIIKTITPNMTEIDVSLELEFFMRRHGAEGLAFETIAVSGTASALPHGKCRNVKLERGFLTMDFGALYEGYCSDMTRTVVIGKADAEMKKLYNTVLEAQLAGIEALRSGLDGYECDKAARDIIDGAGYAGCFGHSLGHGVGMFIHESPRLASSAKGQKLVPGNVVTVEPGIYQMGKGGCRIEDMLAVTADGVYDFTKSPKELIELC